MSARRLTQTTLVALWALAGALASAPADALVTHQYTPALSASLSEPVPSTGPHGEAIAVPGPLTLGPASSTIDSGHLWVSELNSQFTSYRVDEYDASTGAFIGQFAHGMRSAASPDDDGIAIAHLGGESNVYLGEGLGGQYGTPAVAVYGESGTPLETWTGAAVPGGSFGGPVHDVAADNSTDPLDERKGDVYVAVRSQNAIDIFHAQADGEEHYVGQLTAKQIIGFPAGETFEPFKLAVNQADGELVVENGSSIDILEPTSLGEYILVGIVAATSKGPIRGTYAVAVDSGSGEIYLTEGFHPTVIDQFSATGAYLGEIKGEDTPHEAINDVYSMAVDPESHDVLVLDLQSAYPPAIEVFGPDIVIPNVTTEPPVDVTPTSATLKGTVDPDDGGEATCRFDWGTSRSFGETAACEPEEVADGASPAPVHTTLNGLQPDTTYYYRLQAANHNGSNSGEPRQDEEFTTSGPGIHGESVTDLTSTSATFDARIDPHDAPGTYYFQYGTSTAYGTDLPAPPGEAIAAGEGDVEVASHRVSGLLAGTLYHYRIVVVSELKSGEPVVFDGPDATFTTQTAAPSELPDGRQWEMVTSPDKKGARILPIEETGVVQVAANGGAISYLADGPIEAEPEGNTGKAQLLSTRGPEGWGASDIGLPHSTDGSLGYVEYQLFSEDLSLALVQPQGSFVPALSAEASEQTAFLRRLDTACEASCYRPLVTGQPGYANVPPGTVFGEEVIQGVECRKRLCGPRAVGATSDLSHVVLESPSELVRGAGKVPELYEWGAGKLTLVSVLPGGEPAGGASFLGLGEGDYAARRAISDDGSRVVWEEHTTPSALYMRDVAKSKTIQLDMAEPGCVTEGACESGSGKFQVASTDGSKVFFTDSNRLTKRAGRNDLYECEIIESAGDGLECKLSDLTPEERLESDDLQGTVIGASEDGSYVYFAADGVFAEKAIHGSCESSFNEASKCNLYVWHDGTTKLVSVLSGADSHDWNNGLLGVSASVSPDGNWLEFMAQESLTGYDNHDAISGHTDAEVYLYDASTGRVVCASCNPSGARPIGSEYKPLEPGSGGLAGGPRGVWEGSAWVAANVPGWLQNETDKSTSVQPRYLSNSGRLFFDSGDALVPQDVNATEDVYEWEPPGVGGCSTASTMFSERSGGCIGLISAGTSAEESAFLGASATGGDVFLITYSKLAPQDYDSSPDIYDAHECMSASPCLPAAVPQPPACTTAEACRAAPTPQPAAFGAPSSATFSGAGNITPSTSRGSLSAKSANRARKLTSALRACKRKPRKQRAACQRRARTRYGAAGLRKAAAKKKGGR